MLNRNVLRWHSVVYVLYAGEKALELYGLKGELPCFGCYWLGSDNNGLNRVFIFAAYGAAPLLPPAH